MAPGSFRAIRKTCTVGVELRVLRGNLLEGFAGQQLSNSVNRWEVTSTRTTLKAADNTLKLAEVIGASDVDARWDLPIHKGGILTSL